MDMESTPDQRIDMYVLLGRIVTENRGIDKEPEKILKLVPQLDPHLRQRYQNNPSRYEDAVLAEIGAGVIDGSIRS